MRRWLVPLLLVFSLVLLLACTLGPGLRLMTQALRVVELSGTVEVQLAGNTAWRRVDAGAVIKSGDTVRTRQGAHLVLARGNASRLELDPQSVMHVKSARIDRRTSRVFSVFFLQHGRLWMRVRSAAAHVEVQTPQLAVRVRGATVAIAAQPTGSRVSVHDGGVAVTISDERVAVQHGQILRVGGAKRPMIGRMSMADLAAWHARTELLAPYLRVHLPLANQAIHRRQARILGETDRQCSVLVNGSPVVVDSDGTFTTTLPLSPGTNVITVESCSPEARTTVVTREVICQPGIAGGR